MGKERKAEIIITGDEIITGNTLDSNSQFLARNLEAMGIKVCRITVVPDAEPALIEAAKLAFSRSNIIITSGGLGPTDDDLSMAAMSKAAGVELVENSYCLKHIHEHFHKQGRGCPANNHKQAFVPKGATVLDNPNGTACGAALKFEYLDHERLLILLPGPPAELIPMFEKVRNLLNDSNEKALAPLSLRVYGIGESLLELLLRDLIRADMKIKISTYAHQGEIEVVLSPQENSAECASNLAKVKAEIKRRLGNFLLSEDGSTLTEVVFQLLKQERKSIAFAESCTAGLMSGKLSRIPGASEVLKGGVVSYSEAVKHSLLGVSSADLERYTAVSDPVVRAMAEGLEKLLGADLSISVSGLAGPGGGSRGLPLGTVFFALRYQEQTQSIKVRFGGSRELVQNRAVSQGLDIARRALLNLPLQEDLPVLVE